MMKFRPIFIAALGGALSMGAQTVDPVAPVDDCCAVAMDTGPLSPESLYQTEVRFTNDRGEPFDLVALRGRPVVLTMFYASCSHACPMLVTVMQQLRAALPLHSTNPPVFVLVSFDEARDTPDALARYRAGRLLDNQWELLHGDNDAVRELAALLGIKYQSEAGGGFSHSNVISILNVEGEVVHQRIGLMGSTDEAEQVLRRLAGADQ